MKTIVILFSCFASLLFMGGKPIDKKACACEKIPLKGKVKFVSEYPDFTIKIVKEYPDISIKIVKEYPDQCGEWEIVEEYPDFTVKIVEEYPDFTIRYVTTDPGL